MKKNIIIFIFVLISQLAVSQTIGSFENFSMQPNSFLNGSDGKGGFSSSGFYFKNSFNQSWGSWSGFAVSNGTDIATRGYTNQYSAITGTGAMGTKNYGVCYVSGTSEITFEETRLAGIFITNSTYAYWSMKEGDMFSKKFGGKTGSDPDWFKLTIQGVKKNGEPTNSIEVYLADFRGNTAEEDFILKNWRWVDLSSLGQISSLKFSLSSSDVGSWGMNTPAYFCVDQLNYQDKAPIVKKNIGTITENNRYLPDFKIQLNEYFADEDTPFGELTFTVSNDNPNLVQVKIDNQGEANPQLSFKIPMGKTGIANFTVTAESNNQKVSQSFGLIASYPANNPLENLSGFNVYPNPFNDYLNIGLPANSQTVTFYGPNGSILKTMDVSGKKWIRVDQLSGFAYGSIIMMLKTNETVLIRKLVKH